MTQAKSKIKPLSELAQILAPLRKEGKRLVMCHGVFDLLHPGHIRHLNSARQQGDILVITVTPDRYVNKGPGHPIFPVELRAEVLASLAGVDYVAVNEWPTAVEAIRMLRPAVYAKGSDYKDHSQDVTGGIIREQEAVQEVGGKITFTDEITFSSSSIANNAFKLYSDQAETFLRDFRGRVREGEIIADLKRVSQCKALVIGDAIVDEYHYCQPMNKSPKENLIPTRYISQEAFAGGVMAAANHVASLCDQVDMITCLGRQDSREEFIRSHLKPNVSPTFFFREEAPTTIKRRFVEPNYMRKLFEVCFLDGEALRPEIDDQIAAHLDQILPQYDLVLITDFGHGLMSRRLIELVCKKSRFLAVNAQSNSANVGYNLVTKYPRADYICVDAPEAQLALHDRVSNLDLITRQLSSKLDAHYVSITHGNHGCIVYGKDQGVFKIPALTNRVVDTVGAGDAFLSISSPCVAMGFTVEQVGFIGNAAGALKVGIVGNRSSVTKESLFKFVSTLLK